MDILRSKKFQAALIGLIVAFVSEFGLDLDPAEMAAVLSPILAYILGQGWADTGKEAVIAKGAIDDLNSDNST